MSGRSRGPTHPEGLTRRKSLPALVALGALLTGCAAGPDYARPDVPRPVAFKSPGEPAATPIAPDWWLLYRDPELARLILVANASNPTLQQAVAAVDEARAQARIAASELFPSAGLGPSFALQRPSKNRVNPLTGKRAGSTTTSTDWLFPLDLAYELDVFGRIRRGLEAARADAVGTLYLEASVRLTLQTNVAQSYYALRLLDAQREILFEMSAAFREEVHLLTAQITSGLADPLALAQARAQLESTLAQERDLRRVRDDQEHALAVLCGQPPAAFSFAREPPRALSAPAIPAGLPAELLRRRPDVAAAEQRVVAANARIGVAVAELYPSFTITSTVGFESINLKSLFDWQSRLASLFLGLTAPIFQGGRLRAGLDAARAQHRQEVAAYLNQVLVAYGDVEDALTDVQAFREIVTNLERAVSASQDYLRFARTQYKFGLVNYLVVIDAERTLLTNQLSLAQNVNLQMGASIRLVKALGGGWDMEARGSGEAR